MVTRRSRKKGLREGEVTKTSWILNPKAVMSDQRGILSFFFDIKNEEEVKLESPSFQNEAPEKLV